MKNKKDYSKGFLFNCVINMTEKDKLSGKGIFHKTDDSRILACLDGYAVIPVEEYNALKQQDKTSSDRPKLPGGGGAVRKKP